MIELLVLFLGVYGALATPHLSHVNHDVHYHLDNDTEVVDGQLPGTENLNEKALPLSHLFATGMNNLLANNNLAEKSQIPQRLPGIENLAEKRILDVVLKKLTQFPEMKEKSNLSLVKRERGINF